MPDALGQLPLPAAADDRASAIAELKYSDGFDAINGHADILAQRTAMAELEPLIAVSRHNFDELSYPARFRPEPPFEVVVQNFRFVPAVDFSPIARKTATS